MKTLKRGGTLLLCLLTVLLSLPRALAAGAIQTAQESSLTVVYADSGTALTGVEFALYRVADVSPGGQYTLTGGFAGCPIDLNDPSSGAALAGAGYALLNGIPPLARGTTDNTGRVTFTGLTPGLFLVVGSAHVQNGTILTVAPFFAALPALNYSTNDWEYSVVMTPKHGGSSLPSDTPDTPDSPSSGTVERRVLKIWEDDGLEAQRPARITVWLLRNGQVFDSASLTADNGWSWKWTGLDAGYDWTVMETVPDGYTVEIERVGVTFVITNSRSDTPEPTPTPETTPTPTPTPETTPSPDDEGGDGAPDDGNGGGTHDDKDGSGAHDDGSPTLPQTGQLWWPVPVLSFAGLALLLIGCIRKRGAGDEE